MLADHRDRLSSSSFSLILDSSVGLSAGIQSAEDWVSETLWVRILHSAEEDNLSPFDSKIACLCQSIEINNNKYVYRQSQVRMPNGSGVRWAECLLIIGTGCRVQVLAWSSIAQSVCQQAFSLLKIGFQRPSGFESCIQQRKTTCLLSIRKSLACARASKLTTTNMYVCMYIYIYIYIYINATLGHDESSLDLTTLWPICLFFYMSEYSCFTKYVILANFFNEIFIHYLSFPGLNNLYI